MFWWIQNKDSHRIEEWKFSYTIPSEVVIQTNVPIIHWGSSLLGENKTRNLSCGGTDMRSKQSRNISSKVRSVDFKKEKGTDVNTHLNRQHNSFKVPTKNEGGDKKPEANMFEHRNT